MKGPGLRIDVDVRRPWSCPSCGQSQRLTMDVTAPRCLCVRDGVPMKLAEGRRPGRLDLRPELRSIVDRIQAGEEFPRMTSQMLEDSEGGSRDGGPGGYSGAKPGNRPPRPERSGRPEDRPPRESRPEEPQRVATSEAASPPALLTPAPQAIVIATPQPPVPPSDDDFGAGLNVGDSPAPQ